MATSSRVIYFIEKMKSLHCASNMNVKNARVFQKSNNSLGSSNMPKRGRNKKILVVPTTLLGEMLDRFMT